MDGRLHVRVKLLLAVLHAVPFALQCALALEALVRAALEDAAFAEQFDQSRLLHLLLEALLQAVIGLFAVFVGMDCHKVRGS